MSDSKPVLFALAMATLPVALAAAPQDSAAAAEASIARLEQVAGGALQVTRGPEGGPARFIAVRGGAGIAVSGTNAEARARAFLGRYGSAFGLAPTQELRLVRPSEQDELGMEHVRLQQAHFGIPVTGAEMMVHLRGGRVLSASGRAMANLDRMDTIARIPGSQAAESARKLVAKYYGEGEVTLSTPRLEILDLGLIGGPPRPAALAWFVEATRLDVRELVWVGARDGRMLLHFSQLTKAKNRAIYTSNNTGVLPGTLIRRETGRVPPSRPPDADGDAAFEFSGDTYDYFLNQHGRDSFDGRGALIKSSVHYCPGECNAPYENAFWNGVQMVYGEGFPVADDVDAHELTHAITDRTAGLFYYMQSGALNESYSDIFGETVDQTNAGGTDTPAVKWQIGEDIPGFGALRDMANPNVFGDPGKMSDAAQYKCIGDPFDPNFDLGGVHSNSGVPNHAFVLMVDGGTFNSVTVNGIGLEKAGKVQYRALTRYLTTGSNFLDNYNALIQSCSDLIGTAGITIADCNEVENALDAVEMASPPPCPGASTIPASCPAGQGPVNVFFDDLEKRIAANWKNTVQHVGNHWTLIGGGTGKPPIYYDLYASSGQYHFLGYDFFLAGSSSVEMAKSVVLPPNAFMRFDHSYGFDSIGPFFFDGGVLEYSVDNGVTWGDAGAFMVPTGADYNGSLFASTGNPLGGRQAFVGESWGYTTTMLDLSSRAGQPIRFRFHIATDDSVDDYGWLIDDIQIYTCASGGTVELSAPAFGGSEAAGKAIVTATRTGGTAPVTVDYYTMPFSAVPGEDYTPKTGTLSFGVGETSKTFEIPILNDTDDDDSDEGFKVFLHNVGPSAALGAMSSADVSIADNDLGGAIQLKLAAYKAMETGQVMITLTRTGGAASGATVHYFTSNGSAMAGSDYTATSGFLTFGAGQMTAKFAVPILADTLEEADVETFNVNLDTFGGGATPGARTTAPVNITDNDEGGLMQFKLANVRVSEGVGTATVVVTRTGGAASEAKVDFEAGGGSATATADYAPISGTLTFGAGETSKSFEVEIEDDATPGEPVETINLTLSNARNGAALGPRSTAVISITDN
jgi:Zn-dependent metalloprotease